MNKIVPLGLGAAALLAAVLVGTRLLAPAGPPGPGVSPSLSASIAALPPGALEPGTYLLSDVGRPVRTLVPYTITVPAGWSARAEDRQLTKNGDTPTEISFTPWIVTHVYADACDSAGKLGAIGPTVDDFVAALEGQANSDTTTPVDLEVDGHPARFIRISVPDGLDTSTCRHPDLLIQIWADAAENDYFAIPLGPPEPLTGAYVVDVNGKPVVFITEYLPTTPRADIDELEAMIASIRFQP